MSDDRQDPRDDKRDETQREDASDEPRREDARDDAEREGARHDAEREAARHEGRDEGSASHDEPHGVVETLVEEIEEKIEEAVEHVPEPVRWTVGKLTRLILLLLAGLFVLGVTSAVLFFMNRTELVARELSLLLNRTLREHSDLTLDMRDIRGNPFTGFRAVEPRVRFPDGSTVLEAREMRVDYTAWALIMGQTGSIDVTLDRPLVRLTGEGGKWRLPIWRSNPSTKKGKPRPLQVTLHIRNGDVFTPRPYGSVTGLNSDLVANLGPETRVRLERLRWDSGPWDSRLEKFAADLRADTSGVRVRVTELYTKDLELRGEAAWRGGSPVRSVAVNVARVRWRWLAKVFENKTFDVPGEGAFVVDLTGAQEWMGRFKTKVEWDSLNAEGTGIVRWNGTLLAIDSLRAYSPAGDVTGGVRWSSAGWQVAGNARNADPARWSFLHLHNWPAGKLNGFFRYQVDTRSVPFARLDARLGDSEWQGWRADSAHVTVEFPANAPDSFRVAGLRRGGQFTLRGRTDARGGWSGPFTVRDLPLDEWPDGRASGLTGRLTSADGFAESRAGGLWITGTLRGSDTRWGAGRFAHWTLSDVKGRLIPTPDLRAQAQATNGFFLGIHVDSAYAPIQLGDQVAEFLPLTAQAGDTTIAMTGEATWNASTWAMTLSAAEVRSDQFHFTAEPPVRIAGDAGGVVFDRLIATDSTASVAARGRWAAPGGAYDFEFRGTGLDFARLGFPREQGLGGRGELRLTVQGRPGDPRWHLEARAGRPSFGGHHADSLALMLAGGAHRLDLEDGLFVLRGGSIRAAGAIERIPAAFPDSLSPTALLRWTRDAGSWRAHATASAFPVAPVSGVLPDANGWDGSIDGTLTLSGRPQAPIVDVAAHADRFGWRGIRAERVDVRARYADGRVEANDIRARMQNVESTARLSVPLTLALGRPVTVPDEAIRGRVDVPSGDLQLLPLIVPQIQSARGRFELAAEIGGTTKNMKLTGNAQIREGILRPANRGEVLEGLGADLHFDQSRVVLDTLWANQGRTGRVWANGTVSFDRGRLQNYRFATSMREFAASEEGLYAVLFDGDFVVSDGPRVGGERLPQVIGQARIKRGVVEFDFANQSEVQKRAATTQPLFWTYHIQADAKNNLRWRTAEADIEFAADLDLQQTPDSLLIYGEMHALRGTYWFLSNRFKIVNADLTFDNQQGVDPIVDITAETRVRRSSAPGSSGGPETITAQLTGRASQPVISLASSEPTADQRSIIEGLTIGTLRDPLTGNIGATAATSYLDNYFTRQLNSQLSANMSEFFRGAITEWELQRDRGDVFTGEGDFVVGVGSQLTDRLALRYRQRVGRRELSTVRPDAADLFEQNVEAEYRINRFIYVTSGVSKRRTGLNVTTQPNTDYNVNLKARWEY